MAVSEVSSPLYPSPAPAPSIGNGTKDLSSVSDVALSSLDKLKATLSKLTEFSESQLKTLKGSNSLLAQALINASPDIFDKLTNLSSEELADLLKYFPHLQSLDLGGFHQITAIALPRISTLHRLTTLNLCGTQITNIRPLIDNPLPSLVTVNFFETDITHDSLLDFLDCHTISTLFPPRNPPEGFFGRFQSFRLVDVRLHIDKCGSAGTMTYLEIIEFLKKAPLLRILQVWTNDDLEFTSKEVRYAPTNREFVLECKDYKNIFQLINKS